MSEMNENESKELETVEESTELTVAEESTEISEIKEESTEPATGEGSGELTVTEKEDTSPKGLLANKKLLLFAGIGIVVIVIVIILICTVFTKKDITSDKPYDNDVLDEISAVPTSTPEPTSTPVPTVEPTAEPTATPVPTEAPKPVIHTEETQSELTGEWTSKEITVKRPYCIMFNNIEFANPQSGIGCADILYEALTEGGITRMMGVFEGLTEESTCKDRIGSVRSARHYFASFADEYDSIFIHYGETTYATKRIADLKLDHLEGTYGIGDTVFYRDKTIKAPHNAFASLSGIWKGIEKMKFRTDHNEDWTQNHFAFVDRDLTEALETYTEDNPDELIAAISSSEDYTGSGFAYNSTVGRATTSAALIQLNYSKYMSPFLTYDETTGLYTRHQYNDVHIDYNTNLPLTFTNVIIQIVHEWDKDKNGYQDMELHDANGTGYYITEGKCIPITWVKNENKRKMNYYTEDGEILVLNNGKTFISAYPDFRTDKLVIE